MTHNRRLAKELSTILEDSGESGRTVLEDSGENGRIESGTFKYRVRHGKRPNPLNFLEMKSFFQVLDSKSLGSH